MANPFPANKSRPLNIILIGLLGLLALYFVLHALFFSAPAFLVRTHAPSNFQWRDGGWFWMEGAGKPGSRLVRNAGGTQQVVATGQIGSYSSAANKVVWSIHDNARWSVFIAGSNGSDKQAVWTGDREPRGLCLADGRLYWLEDLPPVVPDSGPLPPLGERVNLVSLPLSGGSPTIVTTLMEPKGEQVLGVQNGQVYAATSRPGPQACTVFYRIPLGGGVPYRIAGEVNTQQALLSHDGRFYWTADSPEASNSEKIACIRRFSGNGPPETLGDWMPAHGKVYETDRGVCYVDGDLHPSAWNISAVRDLPNAKPLPENYSVLAVGGSEMLLQSTSSLGEDYPIYRMAVP